MSKQTTKYIYAFLMVLILIILPYTTWVALQKGERYLVAAVEDIKTPKDSLDNFSFILKGSKIDTVLKADFEGQVVLLFHEKDYKTLEPNLLEFDKQMAQAAHLQFIQLYSDYNQIPQDLSGVLHLPVRNMYDANDFKHSFSDKLLAIVDTKGMLRTGYDENREEFIMLVKHLSLLLPRIERGK